MIHSVEFLDQAGNILSATLVEAPDDPSAFRMVADYWPGAAYCIRILPVLVTAPQLSKQLCAAMFRKRR